MISELLRGVFSGNQVISGGMILMIVGGSLAYARAIPSKLFNLIKNRVMVTVEIDGTDLSFSWIRAWIATKGRSRFMSAGVAPRSTDSNLYSSDFKTEKPRFFLVPRGVCWFMHRGRVVIAWLSKEKVDQTVAYRETIVFRAIFAGNDFFKSIMDEAYEYARIGDKEEVQVWVPDGSDWRMLCRKSARSQDSLILPDGIMESVIGDAKKFLSEKEWYEKKGIPHRRSYLFYGPPGTGKSSLAHVLASELKMNVNIATLSQLKYDEHLNGCLSKVPSQNLLVLEDVDATTRESDKGPSFSSFLNAIDGLAAQDGRILIMTTNHIEKLDPALIRPGRADVKVYVGPATYGQAHAMFMRFFPDHRDLAPEFADSFEGKSMATIQEHLLANRDSANDACKVNSAVPSVGLVSCGQCEEPMTKPNPNLPSRNEVACLA